MRYLATYLLLFFGLFGHAQDWAYIKGSITDLNNNILEGAVVELTDTTIVTYTNSSGEYILQVPPAKLLNIYISFSSKSVRKTIAPLKPGQIYILDIKLNTVFELGTINIKGQKVRREIPSYTVIEPRTIEGFPVTSGFESTLKSIGLGIGTGGGELSTGYNVRGGNFDENLVYVNNIEVYRPFLARSGQQEGLSVINLDMIENIEFSAGGFEAKYGDKMSSVLNINYRVPDSTRATVRMSLLGAGIHFEGISDNTRFSYLVGARYRSNQYLLGTLDVQGDYNPRFYDIQSLLRYRITYELTAEWFSSIAQNRYLVAPQSQSTNFGNVNRAFNLFIAFGGQELMQYTTLVNGLKFHYHPNRKSEYMFILSNYNSTEREHFTVEGAYRLSELETNLGSDNFANIRSNLGFGYFIDNARNDLYVRVNSAEFKGRNEKGRSEFHYGVGYKHELIDDALKEWRFNDSSGYNINTIHSSSGKDSIVLDEYLRANIDLSSYRYTAYAQHRMELSKVHGLILNYGVRSHYWSYNGQNVISPRAYVSFKPNKEYNDSLVHTLDSLEQYYRLAKPDWVFKFATGVYYQPPFYRELRDIDGVLNPELRAQRSIHFVLGADRSFRAWGRPFKFISEIYYKKLDHLVPYVIDNVRVRYLAENSAQGYATGFDARVNGEFIEGIESWFNFSILKTQERISYEDENGSIVRSDWLRRPTDQRVNFSILFQDELPSNPSYKMNLNLVFGSRMPYFFDPEAREKEGFTIPPYRRVDIGFSKEVYNGSEGNRPSWLTNTNSLWISLEVFNLLQVNNTISYSLIKDFANNIYGVPNYLTGRRVNLRLVLKI